ncbi:MAG TPA: peptidoglycan editing factor PgeF [Denitromonas sp.]|nr:peptidoglycan editing factor PgeF [Rhodocyclaceae bacterium]MCP5220653.1 peptidoglycan editing factor PgeF [Zoogloeaceae bacterium]HQU87070.1 peptidoglycan editing factor PgeF [Denitromonas sp.]HQV13733.1 peptidoglycan editing factor PgeF [Denitromonas sp.]
MNSADLLIPEWPAPSRVKALMTTRAGGVSTGCFSSLNLGDHVGDDPLAVARNRREIARLLPCAPLWLNQVHGVQCARADQVAPGTTADASATRVPEVVCAVMTADCLPVIFCDLDGTVVAAAHAGWRGLLAGVLESTLAKMDVPAKAVIAWMGAAIGPEAFEVGDEVRRAFVETDAGAGVAFKPATADGKWLADLYTLARRRLAACGVRQVYGGTLCTVADPQRFFSYRRDGQTGRMAAMVWLSA